MTPTGPLYCETGHPFLFMAEPVNTLTNAFIILAAMLAWRRVRQARIGMPADLAVLLALLFVTGIGSFLWHGFRTRAALAADALPGLLFLFVFTGFWIRALFGGAAGLAGALGLIAACAGSIAAGRRFIATGPGMPPGFAFLPAFGVIALVGTALVLATRRRFGAQSARLGAVALTCGIGAAVCRSIDLLVCSAIPTGTHFLWHILLSLAAYLGIVMLLGMKVRGARE